MDIMIRVVNFVRFVIILVQHALLHLQTVWHAILSVIGYNNPINVLVKMAFMIMEVRYAYNVIKIVKLVLHLKFVLHVHQQIIEY